MKLVEKYRWLSVDLQISASSVSNCFPRELDLTFVAISLPVSPHITVPNVQDPISAAAPVPRPFHVSPDIGYNSTDKFYAGGTAAVSWNSGSLPLNTVTVQGYGSSTLWQIEGELKGDRDSTTSWLAHAEWAAKYANSSMPTTAADLNRGRLTANFSAFTRPVSSLVFHFGAVAGGGNDQSGFSATTLAPNVTPSGGYSGVKFYGGFTGQSHRQDFSAGYGLELGGSTNTSLLSAWHKQVGYAQYALWAPFGDHRQVEVEQTFAAGGIGVNQTIPVGELFFGGNSQTYFSSDQSFKILSQPYIRSLPANSFYNTSGGIGAKTFFSYNLTLAATAWRKPLVPAELNVNERLCAQLRSSPSVPPALATKQDLCKKLNGQFNSATNILEAANASDDRRLDALRRMVPTLQAHLDALRDAVKAAQTGTPTSAGPLFDDCVGALTASATTADDAVSSDTSASGAYDDLHDLLADGASPLSKVVSSCRTALTSVSVSEAPVKDVEASATKIQQQLTAIDNDASAKANKFMAFVKRLMYQVLSEVNIVSISPVAVFDVAQIGPAASAYYSGTRYGAGPGIRFTVANTMMFTAAYAWNANRHAGEVPGAFYFSLTTRNIFR